MKMRFYPARGGVGLSHHEKKLLVLVVSFIKPGKKTQQVFSGNSLMGLSFSYFVWPKTSLTVLSHNLFFNALQHMHMVCRRDTSQALINTNTSVTFYISADVYL